MKRLLLITGIVLSAYILMTSALSPSAKSETAQTVSTTAAVTATEPVYTVIDENGRVAVLLNGASYLRTDTLVRDLPKTDQKRLKEGIAVSGRDELRRLLEDLCS